MPQPPFDELPLEEQIDNLIMGRYRQWHLFSAMTSYLGELGREWIAPPDQEWNFVAGFDSKEQAEEAMNKIVELVVEGLPYGGDDWDFEVVDMEVGEAE